MTVATILAKAYRLTNTSSSTFLDGNSTNILAELNTQYGNRILDVLHATVDDNASLNLATTTLFSTTGLTPGDTGYNGEYPFPSDLLKPVRVEISYDGLTWVKATIYDSMANKYSEYDQDIINDTFSKDHPFVDFKRNSYFIRPLPTTSVSNGIYIEYAQRQTDLVADSPVFEPNLHDILAYDLARQEMIMHPEKYDYKHNKYFDEERTRVENRFFQFYKEQLKRNVRLSGLVDSYK